jgi:Flp pilus assembly protein TadG
MRGLRRVLGRGPARRDDERGATAVIVALTLVALLGLIVLTVDVGQLLYKRRSMVNSSDAAALAAAQSCASLIDSDVPEAMADDFALSNTGSVITAAPNIVEMVGCDGPSFGHVTVEYTTNQELFFGGVLGASGPATVRTRATAGWGPAGGANPVPIVVYTGQTQGSCDIQEGIGPGVPCFLWYDNDRFQQSSFGFLNLCTSEDRARGLCSQVGWDVGASDTCPNVGSSQRDDWIAGNWDGGPNEVHYPDVTYVCRVSGLSSSNWAELERRASPTHDPDGDESDLVFPVNDCTQQINTDGSTGCSTTVAPDKYDIIGFIVLHLKAVLDSRAEWEGDGGTCQITRNMNPGSPNIDLDFESAPGCTPPYDAISNVRLDAPGRPNCCQEGQDYTYDPVEHVIDWRGGNRNNVRIRWDYTMNGPCGATPNNSSAVCILVETVEVRFGGTAPGQGADFGLRAVALCDLAYASCPEQRT